MREISDAHMAKYIDTTDRARAKITPTSPSPSWLKRVEADALTMIDSYIDDAKTFYKKQDYVNAFACVNYAHGWLDMGARLGLWDVDGDDVLFTILE